MQYRVVPIAEEHIEGFRAGVDRVAKERRYLTLLEAPPLEDSRKFVLSNIRKGNPHSVALVEDRVVGWCDAVRIERPTRAHTAVLGLGVLAEFRARGIGTALLRATIERAKTAGIERIELTVRESNTRVVPLYQRFGFAIEGTQRRALLVDGRYEDLVCMGLVLE